MKEEGKIRSFYVEIIYTKTTAVLLCYQTSRYSHWHLIVSVTQYKKCIFCWPQVEKKTRVDKNHYYYSHFTQFSIFSTNYLWHDHDILKCIGKTRTLTIWTVLETANTTDPLRIGWKVALIVCIHVLVLMISTNLCQLSLVNFFLLVT